MANIGKIERLRVVIKNLGTGQCEYIANKDYLASNAKTMTILSPDDGKSLLERKTTLEGLRNEGNAYFLPKKILADQVKNLPSLLTQARAIPIMNPDGSMSFKVTDLQPGSIFALLGIDENDIITKVNSKPITNINMIMDMLAGMDKIQKLELEINKDGTVVKKEYNFTQ
jgi:type II secretory pathway component PulC